MNTQISRDSFQPTQRYSAVYLQQGRMIVDADWNELTDIQQATLLSALRDAIAGGAPSEGGLGLVADPAGSTNIRIRPGILYVEGVPARLDASALVAINEQPEYPIGADYSGQNLKLYADVWERAVTALQDSALLDPALHGADTATRSQTMLQVKWCADSLDPLNEDTNPPLGTALLSLKLRLIATSSDSCDPCASQVKVDERLGNYLFRVEVHDYEPATQWLTLKWSRDNGAEACLTSAIPSGFGQGPWVWEYADEDTERLLGNNFAENPRKLRGLIREAFGTPTGANEPNKYVRQWDGYIRIKLDTGALGAGRDSGVPLMSDVESSQAHGRVYFASGVLKINLELLELTLDVNGKRLVPGDYWLAEVREAEDESGDVVLDTALPRGVRHHYLLLGALGVDRRLVSQGDAFVRRMSFPPLTNLTAEKVGLANNCPNLYGSAANVQQALDNLCSIDATDIAYVLPACMTNTVRSLLGFVPSDDDVAAVLDRLLCQLGAGSLPYTVPACDTTPSVRSLLGLAAGGSQVAAVLDKLMCGLNAASLPYTVPACSTNPSVRSLLGLPTGGNQVAPVLDKLLCELRANALPLDKSDINLCSDLLDPDILTVQDALRTLCARSGGGCATVVSSPDQLEALLVGFANSGTTLDLWLCLKPGIYSVGNVPPIVGKRSLRICAEGPESVAILFSGNLLSVDSAEVILENFSFTFSTGAGQLAIRAAESRAEGCRFARTSSAANGPTMISLGGRSSSSACRVDWKNNVLYAQVKSVLTAGGDTWASDAVVGNAELSKALLRLGQPELLSNKVAFDESMLEAARLIVVLPKEKRTDWRTKLSQIPTLPTLTLTPKAGTTALSKVLVEDVINLADAVTAVEDLVAQWIRYDPDYALRLEGVQVGGTLSGNEFDGWLLFGNGIDGYQIPDSGIEGRSFDTEAVKSGGAHLSLDHNQFTAIKANVPPSAIDSNKRLTTQVSGLARLILTGNSFAAVGNSVVAVSFVGQGNTWFCTASDSRLGSIIADRASFAGNVLEEYTDDASLYCTAFESLRRSSTNVLIELSGP